MGWTDTFKQILSKLKSDLKSLKIDENAAFDAVYIGRKAAPTQFPCAFIFPRRVRERPATAGTSVYEIQFEIRVVSKAVGGEAGLTDALTRIGAVESMLIADRSYGGLVDNLEVDEIQPEIELPRVRERHESALRVTFRKLM